MRYHDRVGVLDWSAVLVFSVVGSACGSTQFACADDEQCSPGQCVAGGCAFDDDTCESGLRYADHAANGLSGQCVAPAATTSGGSTGPGDGGATSGPVSGSTTSAVDGTGTGAATTTTGAVADDSSGSGSTGEPVDPDLVVWLRCDGNLDGVLVDSSGNGNDALCDTCPTPVAGMVDGACEFDGTAFAEIAHGAAFEVEQFTLAAWAMAGTVPDGVISTIAAKPHGSGIQNVYQIGFNTLNGPLVLMGCYGAEGGMTCINDSPPKGWVHVALTYDGTDAVLYFGGTQVATGGAVATLGYDGSPLIIGRDVDNGSATFPMYGAIDDVRLYARALSPAEVSELAGL